MAFASAGLYCISMVAMKSWWVVSDHWTVLVIAGALLAVGAFEVAALRDERLGLVYVSSLGAEVVIIGAASLWLFGETCSPREIAGIALVLVGTALAWA